MSASSSLPSALQLSASSSPLPSQPLTPISKTSTSQLLLTYVTPPNQVAVVKPLPTTEDDEIWYVSPKLRLSSAEDLRLFYLLVRSQPLFANHLAQWAVRKANISSQLSWLERFILVDGGRYPPFPGVFDAVQTRGVSYMVMDEVLKSLRSPLRIEPIGATGNHKLHPEIYLDIMEYLEIPEAEDIILRVFPQLLHRWCRRLPILYNRWFSSLCNRNNMTFLGTMEGVIPLRNLIWGVDIYRLRSFNLHPDIQFAGPSMRATYLQYFPALPLPNLGRFNYLRSQIDLGKLRGPDPFNCAQDWLMQAIAQISQITAEEAIRHPQGTRQNFYSAMEAGRMFPNIQMGRIVEVDVNGNPIVQTSRGQLNVPGRAYLIPLSRQGVMSLTRGIWANSPALLLFHDEIEVIRNGYRAMEAVNRGSTTMQTMPRVVKNNVCLWNWRLWATCALKKCYVKKPETQGI